MRTIAEIKACVEQGVKRYNADAPIDRRIVRVELFGSYARGEQTENSDLDLLVEFANDQVSLFNIAAVLMAMEEETGMSVDVVQMPLPEDSFLEIDRTVSLYEAA